MSDTPEYKVHKVFCKELNYDLLILEFPKEELEDKLSFFSKEKGHIQKDRYDEYILATCVANINQLLYKISQSTNVDTAALNLPELKIQFLEHIFSFNEGFRYSNVYLDSDKVLRIKSKDKVLEKGELLLEDNRSWKTAKSKPKSEAPITKKELQELSAIKFDVENMWWRRIGRYVEVKKYKEEDMPSLLQKRFFHSRTSFAIFVVTVCVVDFEGLFQLLDNMGVPARVAPHLLMHELYDLCQVCNPFLTFDDAQKQSPENTEDVQSCDCKPGEESKKTKANSAMGKYANKPKQEKRFKNVPKEDLINLAQSMKVSLIGQDTAVDSLVTAIQRASVGLKDPAKPIGSFLFAGSTGCGKTLCSKVLAEELIKDRNDRIVIDCSEYSSDHEYSKLIGCFVPGTKVLKADGTVSNIEEVEVGDEVVSHTGNKRKVSFVHEYDQDGEMIKFTTVNSNIPVTTTKTHEILVIKGQKCAHKNCEYVVCKPTCSKKDCSFKPYENYKPEWVAAKDLEKGDITLYPRVKITGVFPTKLDLVDYVGDLTKYKWDDNFIWAQKHVKIPRYIVVGEALARLGGYYVSEGGSSSTGGTINFTFNSIEHKYIIEVVKLVRKLFGSDVRISVKDRVAENNTFRIFISSKIICNLMTTLFGKNTHVKKLPVWFNELPEKALKGFLQTAVFGDGCTVVKRRMDYSTVSSNLFYQMEQLFRKLGFITHKQLEKVPEKATRRKTDRYRLYISGNQINELERAFKFDIDMGGMKNTNIQRMSWMDENYQYLQIKKVEIVDYKGKVYDLAVEEDASYITEVAVHNSPPNIAYEQGGVLTNAVLKNPFSVVVFDEIEKASSKVFQLLLQVLDEGRLTDNKGVSVSFKDTIIIMTSNIGSKDVAAIGKVIGFGDVNEITAAKKSKAIEGALKKKFKPEFLNRIDEIIYFNDLKKKDYERIIDLELYKLNENLKTNDTEYKSLTLVFDDKVKKIVYTEGIDEEYGARPLKRAIERHISTPLAIKLLMGNVEKDANVCVSAARGKALFDIKPKVAEPPFYLATATEIKIV